MRLLVLVIFVLPLIISTPNLCAAQEQEAEAGTASNSSPSPATATAAVVDETPFARITSIVVAGKQFADGDAKRVKVIREKRGPRDAGEPGRPGMALFANDRVIVGDDTRVVIAYLSYPSDEDDSLLDEYTELVLDSGADVRISNPAERQGQKKKSKWRQYLGRVIAETRGTCDVKNRRRRAIAKGTEFQFKVNGDNSVELLVLEGEVRLEDGDFEELNSNNAAMTASPDQIGVKVACGQKTDFKAQVIVNNNSQRTHSYQVSTSRNVEWFRLLTGGSISLPPGRKTVDIKAQIDTTEQCDSIKTYEETLAVSCSDCDDDKSVGLAAATTVRIKIEVTKPVSLTVKDLEMVTVQADGSLPSGATQVLDEQVVRDALSLIDDATVAAQPSYRSPPRMIPRYKSDPKSRGEEFKKARIDAVWNRNVDRLETIGDIYLDWGEGAKALQAYERASQANSSREDTAEFLINWSEAARSVGNIGLAEGRMDFAERRLKALSETNSSKLYAEASIVLGNIELDKAWRAYAAGDTSFMPLLEDAGGHYSLATSENNPDDVRVVALTNYAIYLRTRGTARLSSENISGARSDYQLARKYLERAQKLDPEYPYTFTNLGNIYTNLGGVEWLSGNKSKMVTFYKRADREYDKAISKYPDLVEAYIGRGTLNANRGIKYEKAARENYDLAIQNLSRASLRSVEVPNVKGKTKSVALEMIIDVGLIPVVVNEGDAINASPKHCVMTQSIKPGTTVTEGDRIILQFRVQE